MTGEAGKGESGEDGEWDSGVVTSEEWLFTGRRICDCGRGIGTPCGCGGREICVGMERIDEDGEDEALD
jgi:hypothetical protein